jgi:signal transduction histidine kinase
VAAAVGHEIRAPLATAILYLEIAESGLDSGAPGAVRAALGVAREQIQHIETLVSRMIEMQRHGRARIEPRLVDAGRVVSETVRRLLAGDDRDAQVSVDIAAPGLTGWWDRQALEQIVHNLLSNALKFGEGRPIAILVERPDADGALRISVRDGGLGIPLADRERIFLGRVSTRRASQGRSRGLGLGLWLVRELAQAHEGDVAVESQPGRGSTFIVTLHPQPPRDAEDRAAPAGRKP